MTEEDLSSCIEALESIWVKFWDRDGKEGEAAKEMSGLLVILALFGIDRCKDILALRERISRIAKELNELN